MVEVGFRWLRTVAGSCERVNQTLDSIRGKECVAQPSDCYPYEDRAAWNYLT
jgi:hypothetical protein